MTESYYSYDYVLLSAFTFECAVCNLSGEQLARTIEAAISGSPLVDLLRQPGGCGEQNMMHMTLPLIATHYLDETKQWDKVGLERRKEAVNFIQMGEKL